LRRVRTGSDLTRFLQEFWGRRDDDPYTDENPFALLFAERVQAADRLYVEEGLRGSLTDRGGALLLLGPPGILRSTQRRVPAWTGNPPPGARPTRVVQLEVWAYPLAELDPRLRGALADAAAATRSELTLTFMVGARQTRLVDGRELLALAARIVAGCLDEDEPSSPACAAA
jgi:GWxTD domain-containing protein